MLGFCLHCGNFGRLEKDHQIPTSQGGPDISANFQFLCPNCHVIKTTLERGWKFRVSRTSGYCKSCGIWRWNLHGRECSNCKKDKSLEMAEKRRFRYQFPELPGPPAWVKLIRRNGQEVFLQRETPLRSLYSFFVNDSHFETYEKLQNRVSKTPMGEPCHHYRQIGGFSGSLSR